MSRADRGEQPRHREQHGGRAAAAEYDAANEKFTLYCGTQGSWLVKNLLAGSVFNLPPEKFRVVTPDVGGGFGMKLYLYGEYALVCMAARRLGRPVKWTSERTEAFQSDTQGRDNITEASWRSTRTASSWRCAPPTTPAWAPIFPPSRR